jgi:hypothetical protein
MVRVMDTCYLAYVRRVNFLSLDMVRGGHSLGLSFKKFRRNLATINSLRVTDTCYLAYCKKGTREAMFLNFPREILKNNFPWEIKKKFPREI